MLNEHWDRMTAFFRIPQQHWKHLRTSNSVESPFAALRLRTNASKRFKKLQNTAAGIGRLLLTAEKNSAAWIHRNWYKSFRRGSVSLLETRSSKRIGRLPPDLYTHFLT